MLGDGKSWNLFDFFIIICIIIRIVLCRFHSRNRKFVCNGLRALMLFSGRERREVGRRRGKSNLRICFRKSHWGSRSILTWIYGIREATSDGGKLISKRRLRHLVRCRIFSASWRWRKNVNFHYEKTLIDVWLGGMREGGRERKRNWQKNMTTCWHGSVIEANSSLNLNFHFSFCRSVAGSKRTGKIAKICSTLEPCSNSNVEKARRRGRTRRTFERSSSSKAGEAYLG